MKIITVQQLFLLCILRKGLTVSAKNIESFASASEGDLGSNIREFYIHKGDFLTLASREPDVTWFSSGDDFDGYSYNGIFEIDTTFTETEEAALGLIGGVKLKFKSEPLSEDIQGG